MLTLNRCELEVLQSPKDESVDKSVYVLIIMSKDFFAYSRRSATVDEDRLKRYRHELSTVLSLTGLIYFKSIPLWTL